jgi:hypothetical protein
MADAPHSGACEVAAWRAQVSEAHSVARSAAICQDAEPRGVRIVWGLVGSKVTLFVVPVLYRVLALARSRATPREPVRA